MNMNLSPDNCLEILRAADAGRVWNSLDEERVCRLCEKTITGRQIIVIRTQPGRFSLHCPTPDCASTVQDWLYPELLSAAEATAPAAGVRTVEMDFTNW